MSKIITIAINGKPIKPSIRVPDVVAADTYLRNRFGADVGPHSQKMKGTVWFNGNGAARMMFAPLEDSSVRRALPKLGLDMVIWIDSEETFAAMQEAVNAPDCRVAQVVDA